jgi:hypothetical protein
MAGARRTVNIGNFHRVKTAPSPRTLPFGHLQFREHSPRKSPNINRLTCAPKPSHIGDGRDLAENFGFAPLG